MSPCCMHCLVLTHKSAEHVLADHSGLMLRRPSMRGWLALQPWVCVARTGFFMPITYGTAALLSTAVAAAAA